MNRETIIENCKKYLGKPYVWGGENMEEGGYDCSGYAYNVLKDSGFNVGRTTADGYRKLGKKISIDQKQNGDLLFFGTSARATHIAIYAGNGKMYESIGSSKNTKSNPGRGVTLSNVSRRSDLFEVRTLFEEAATATQNRLPATSVSGQNSKEIVKAGQTHANNFVGAGIKVDGIRGTETQKAGIKVLQTGLNLTYKTGLVVDGVARTKTNAALKGKTVRKGDTNHLVTALEILLMLKGYNPNGVENPGEFGSGLDSAVRQYQKDNRLTVDGIAGEKTFHSLIL